MVNKKTEAFLTILKKFCLKLFWSSFDPPISSRSLKKEVLEANMC